MTDIIVSTAQGGTNLDVDVTRGTDLVLDVSVGNQITLAVDKGMIGPQGEAATIAVGTTTTLSAGSNATVNNSGTSSDAIFNFGIPQGIQGIQGIQGVQGIQGPTGATGATGAGVAVGGTTGQVLTKTSNADYATNWTTPTTGTVTSVGISAPSIFNVTGSPITSSGTLALSYSGTALPVANGGTGATTLTGYVKGTGTTAMTANSTIPNTDITGLGTASTKDAGAALGVATLDASGKVPITELPAAILGALNYQGTWDASSNTPTLTSSVGTKGYYYVVSVAGNTNLNGITDWILGDWAVYNGTVWQKVDNTEAVTSVNGQTGAVNITLAGLGAGTIATQNANAVAITGGTINGTTIGASTPSTVNATTLSGQTGVLRGTGQNLLTQSNTFSSWTNNNQTLTGSQPDPFGGSTATLLVPTVTNSFHVLYRNAAFIATLPYTVSIYVKASGYDLVYLSDTAVGVFACSYNLSTLAVTPFTGCTGTITAVTGAVGWYRLTLTTTTATTTGSIVTVTGYPAGATLNQFNATFAGNGTSGIVIYGAQVEFGSTANTYIPTTTTVIYGTPTLSFSGVSEIGLQSNGALYLQPAGTGAIQAQATTSTAAGGNVRGANAVDWQTSRGGASQVASSTQTVIAGGQSNTASGFAGAVLGGVSSTNTGGYSVIGGGLQNSVSGSYAGVFGGFNNTAAGIYNFIGGGYQNSGTANAAVTTQATTTVTSGSTAVTLSGSNANIKVGQRISGTGIVSYPNDTYVSAISGTSLTLSQNASATGTPTLSFFTPHGVVVGGGNNQATGSYSFIGGGGDAGTAANRNVASGDWSFVGGGIQNTASGIGSVVAGGGLNTVIGAAGNTASGLSSFVSNGIQNVASGIYSFVGGGAVNAANSIAGSTLGGYRGTTRSIAGNTVFSASVIPVAGVNGINQTALLVLARQTTDATPTALASDSSAAGTTNQVILPNNSAYYFKGSVIANVTGAANGAAWSIEGAIMRGANAASTVLIDTPSVNRVAASAGATAWSIAITADTTNGGIAVTVTGVAATTIRWVAKLETTEVTF